MAWLSGWSYRKSHDVGGSVAGVQTNYQKKVIAYYGDTFAETSLIGTGTYQWMFGATYQRYAFHHNGRYWVFYGDGAQMVYRTSLDGITWTALTVINNYAHLIGGYYFCIVFDGTYVHYVRMSDNAAGNSLLYRMGTPEAAGTITWAAVEQTAVAAVAGHWYIDPHIVVDSNGFPWIGFGDGTGVSNFDGRGWVTKSSTSNGTWTTEGGFPFQISATVFNYGARPSCWVAIASLTGGKMYAMVQSDGVRVEGNLWNGAAWAGTEFVTTSNTDSACISPVPEGDDVHLTFTNAGGTFYVKYTFGVGWGAEEVVDNVMPAHQTVIGITGTTLYCYWLKLIAGSWHGIYRQNISGVWQAEVTWFKLEAAPPSSQHLTCYERPFNNELCFFYETGTGSPYSARIAIPKVVDDDENVILDGKCRTDFGDVRFTGVDGITEYDYWMQEKVDSGYAIFWVELDTIPVNPNTVTIYVYYGLASETTTSSLTNTMPWWDDLSLYNIADPPNAAKWNTAGINGDTITVQADPADATQKVFQIHEDGAGGDYTWLYADFGAKWLGFAFHYRLRESVDRHIYINEYEDAAVIIGSMRDNTTDRLRYYTGVYVDYAPVQIIAINTWYTFISKAYDAGTSYHHMDVDEVDLTGAFFAAPTNGVNLYGFAPATGLAVNVFIGGIGTDNRYLFQRNSCFPEPTHDAWGAEESPSVAVADIGVFSFPGLRRRRRHFTASLPIVVTIRQRYNAIFPVEAHIRIPFQASVSMDRNVRKQFTESFVAKRPIVTQEFSAD